MFIHRSHDYLCKKSEEPTKKRLKLMREFRKKTVAYQINIQELSAFLY